MANDEKDPISSILVLKIVGILALISVMLALPLIFLSEAKRAVHKLAEEEATRTEEERLEPENSAKELQKVDEETQPKGARLSPDGRENLPSSPRQRAFPIGYGNTKDQQPSDWPDASRFAVRHADVPVEVRIDDLRWEEDQFLIKLRLANLSPASKLEFLGWEYEAVHSSPLADWPRLANLKGKRFKLEEAKNAGSKRTRIVLFPGDSANTWLAFRGVDLEPLRLELPASAFQGSGVLRLEIPKGMVVLKAAPSVGVKVLPDLTELVKSSEAETRIQAASALGALGIDAAPAVANLSSMLTDSDPLVRVAGLQALGKIGAPSRQALREILSNMGDSNTLVAKEAAQTIDKLRPLTARDLPALKATLQDPNPETRRFAVDTIGSLGPEAATAAPALTAVLSDMDSSVRAAAALVLAKIGPPSASIISALDRAMQDKDVAVRKNAVIALGKLSIRNPATDSAKNSAEKSASFPSPVPRGGEGKGEGTENFAGAAIASLIRALNDEDADVFATAAAELSVKGRLTDKDVPNFLEALKAPKPRTRAFAAAALSRLGADSHPAVEALGGLLKDSDVQVRRESAKALARAGSKAWISLAALIKALDDPDPTVQEPVIEALGHIGVLARASIPKLVKARKNPKLHDAATQALIQVAKADVAPIIKALQNPDGIQDRMELIDLLGKIGPDAEEAVPALSDLAANATLPSTRAAATKALEQIRKGGKENGK
jgi:HEAT repeat protein